jgi:nucleotide-binding universal stress UspA family protein
MRWPTNCDSAMPFRKIVFPVDFSKATVSVIPYVAEMARQFNATVTVLNAFNVVTDYPLAPHLKGTPGRGFESVVVPYTPALQELRKQREHDLQEFSRTYLARVSWKARIEDGDAAIVIEGVAQSEETDLIMIPAKGLGRFRRVLLGSVTAKVLHDVSCPVWTSAHEPDPALASPGSYRTILCAVDLNSEPNLVLKAAGLLAQTYGSRVCLLDTEPSPHQQGRQVAAESVRRTFEQALNIDSREAGMDITVRSLDAAVPEGIRRAAIEETADLVVVGRGHHKGSVSRIWSRLYATVRESPCPVLTV